MKRIYEYQERVHVFDFNGAPYRHRRYGDRELYTDERGVLYQRDGGLLTPFALDDGDGVGLAPGHCVDAAAPYRCARCYTDRLQVFTSGSYETSARCLDCGIQQVVHDG